MIAAVSTWWRTIAVLLAVGWALLGLAVFGLGVLLARKLRGFLPGGGGSSGASPGDLLANWGSSHRALPDRDPGPPAPPREPWSGRPPGGWEESGPERRS